jgi:type IV pilus assembly protein PilA
MNIRSKKGFTLVEIMIVVVIIGLLAAMAIPAFQKVRLNSIKKTMDNDARQLASAAQQYFLEYSTTSVAVTYTSSTGVVGGALSPYVARLSKGYTAVATPLTTLTGPVLTQPLLPAAVSYAPEGQRTDNN